MDIMGLQLLLHVVEINKASCCMRASQVVLVVKNLPAGAGDIRDTGLISRLGRSPGEGNGNPLLVFLLGESHGQRRLAGYSS